MYANISVNLLENNTTGERIILLIKYSILLCDMYSLKTVNNNFQSNKRDKKFNVNNGFAKVDGINTFLGRTKYLHL